jgi:hypothetical protein
MRSSGEYTERRRQNIVVNSTFSRPPEHSTYLQIMQGRQPIVVPTPVGTTLEPSCCYSPPTDSPPTDSLPTYTITCSNKAGSLSDPQPTGPFYIIESTLGSGTAIFNFYQERSSLGSQILTLNGQPQLITPTEGFTRVLYIFDCTNDGFGVGIK